MKTLWAPKITVLKDFSEKIEKMGKNKGKGKRVGGMRVIGFAESSNAPSKSSREAIKPKLAANCLQTVPEKLTKQQRRDRNKLAKRLAEQAEAHELGINLSLKDLQKRKESEKQDSAVEVDLIKCQNMSSKDTSSLDNGSGIQTKSVAQAKRRPELPPPCPKHLLPKDRTRFMVPTDENFKEVIDVCYRGFVTQPPSSFSDRFHDNFRKAMEGLETEGCYQFDLTQPLGLGTKVAKTFVSRCLVGEPGCTYKYLGLRMFSFPWQGQFASENMVAIGKLNQDLIKHTRKLLRESGREQYGSCDYNLTLINRCFPDGDVVQLKDEPLFKREKCTVSWHADSTLQHYSTIAVYHCTKEETGTKGSASITHDEDKSERQSKKGRRETVQKPQTSSEKAQSDHDGEAGVDSSWRIALRQAPNTEGPAAGKGSREVDPATAPPAVAIPLPNRHAYFLLDDFNHNNQHSVLAGNTDRYASTHRVCRVEGHTFASIKQRVQSAMQGGRGGATAKQIRMELLLQAELEFEWIRQFYIQGATHRDMHVWWHKPMEELFGLWGELEERIRRNLAVLRDAGGRLQQEQAKLARVSSAGDKEDASEVHKNTRKDLRKRAERVMRVEPQSFDEMSDGLFARRTKRDGWTEREQDPAMKSVPRSAQPLPVKFPIVQQGADEPSSLDVLMTWKREFLSSAPPPAEA